MSVPQLKDTWFAVLLVIMNKTTVSIQVQAFVWLCLHSSQSDLGAGSVGGMVSVCKL